MYNGMLNVYKEKGFTSHDVVAKLRGILHQKKIGHTGTLDPDATGVLPVCLGKGTKLCDMLTDKDKTYEAVMRLGIKTDTQDMSGKVTSQKDVNVTEDEVIEAVMSFVGEYNQIPPMYSALKVNGKKLYELAREGKEVKREARSITIYNIVIKEISIPLVTFEVSCSKGTYIRTLCEDIGDKLGCNACMQELVRTKVSDFKIEDAIKLEEIEKLVSENKIDEYIVPVDAAFKDLQKAVVSEEFEKILNNGNALFENMFTESVNSDRIRVYNNDGKFMAIYKYKQEKECFVPEKMFMLT